MAVALEGSAQTGLTVASASFGTSCSRGSIKWVRHESPALATIAMAAAIANVTAFMVRASNGCDHEGCHRRALFGLQL